ncbi:MAG: TetR/AcrR family transcriptional regulator [Clostridia bacterium]|nr:TetR/AcrR family transcriptional regulator [Clostridia bacterium]NCC43184.1 TetR/AcrR family transcriptional regulator [Clostridia bacterium]
MNEQFFSLPEEKQQRIINAAMEVFACNEYKRASTDLIAAKAEVSKGLLFYYFHNKKELYLYVYEYVARVMKAQIVNSEFRKIKDFFELLEYTAEEKVKILEKNPYIMDFAVKTFYSDKEEVSDALQKSTTEHVAGAYQEYFEQLDLYKFREGTDLTYVYRMLVWMADGYMHELKMSGKPIKITDMMEEFRRWVTMMKKLVYKEEYQKTDS